MDLASAAVIGIKPATLVSSHFGNLPMSKSRRSTLQLVKPVTEPVVSGKITHDSRGNAVWDWDVSTGVLARKSVAELLTSLEPGALSLDAEPDRQCDWSGDPYNRTVR
jgi:hypothetical protein